MENSERRKSVRETKKFSAKCWVMDRDFNPILVDYIAASCLNISTGGMVLEWPAWWKCKGCPYLEKNFTGHFCTVSRCLFDNTERFLVNAALLKIRIEESNSEYYAKVVWIKERINNCHIGVVFES